MFPCRTRGELWRSFCETVSEFSDSIESATFIKATFVSALVSSQTEKPTLAGTGQENEKRGLLSEQFKDRLTDGCELGNEPADVL